MDKVKGKYKIRVKRIMYTKSKEDFKSNMCRVGNIKKVVYEFMNVCVYICRKV